MLRYRIVSHIILTLSATQSILFFQIPLVHMMPCFCKRRKPHKRRYKQGQSIKTRQASKHFGFLCLRLGFIVFVCTHFHLYCMHTSIWAYAYVTSENQPRGWKSLGYTKQLFLKLTTKSCGQNGVYNTPLENFPRNENLRCELQER